MNVIPEPLSFHVLASQLEEPQVLVVDAVVRMWCCATAARAVAVQEYFMAASNPKDFRVYVCDDYAAARADLGQQYKEDWCFGCAVLAETYRIDMAHQMGRETQYGAQERIQREPAIEGGGAGDPY